MTNKYKVKRYALTCPRCGKKHFCEGVIFDSRVSCSCGFDYYAFAADDLLIVLPWSEVMCKQIAMAMRKLVVTTGRCTDIPPELYEDHSTSALDKALEDYQMDKYGTCYVTKDSLDIMCNSLENDEDIEVRWKRNRLDIIELKKKTVHSKEYGSESSRGAIGSKEFTRIISEHGLLRCSALR